MEKSEHVFLIGEGVFADNVSCAVSCTGIGEHLLRTSLAKTAALFVEYRGVGADEAADAAIRYLVHTDSAVLSSSTATAHAREPIRHRACSLERPRTAGYAYRRRSRQHNRRAVRAVGAHGAMIDAREIQ
jgi:Asparaginase